MKTMKKLVASLVIGATVATGLIGCTDMNRQEGGALTGSVIGGLVGSKFGRGDGRIAATLVGAAVGGLAGSSIGRSMDDVDRLKMGQALETVPANRSSSWVNPDSHVRYDVTPTRTYYQSGMPCREYVTKAVIGGKTERVYGTACRMNDGSWQMQN